MVKHRKTIEQEEDADDKPDVRRLEAVAAELRKQRLTLQEEVVQSTAGKLVRIKNHVPFVVTQQDVEEYGCLESAMHEKTVEAEKVCNETVCIEFKWVYEKLKTICIDENLLACVF